jgi:glycosyltransferase involved in cell wall biosynthesis
MNKNHVSLAVVLPDRNVVSESFIQAHIDGLFDHPIEIWGSPRPLNAGVGNAVISGGPLLLAQALRVVTKMGTERAVAAVGRRLPTRCYDAQIAAFLRRSSVDVVLAEYAPTAAVVSQACSVSRTPLVVHFHGFDAYHEQTLTELREPYHRLFQTAYRVVAVSNHMFGQLVNLGCPEARIVLNPYGVDTRQFVGARPKEAPPLLLALGRFVEKKGPLLTLRAFARVQLEEPTARLVMLGEGPLRDRCIALAREFGIEGSIDFPGSVDHVDVATWMRRARCFVQHSLRAEDGDAEGTPVAVLEAASCGLPVVSTWHGGIADAVVDGAGGFLVSEGDVDGMADCLLRLVRDPELAARMGAAGRRHIEVHYSSEVSLDRLRQVLTEAAQSRGATSEETPN